MEASTVLQELAVIFGVAVGVVLALSHVRLPTIAGLIAAGALIGPSGLGWVGEAAHIQVLAEIGVVLLLFGIGLEFSLERLRRLWKVLTLGGALQVGLTTLATLGLARALGQPVERGIFFGFLVALSSTAIVLRALTDRHETDAPHGRLIIGALGAPAGGGRGAPQAAGGALGGARATPPGAHARGHALGALHRGGAGHGGPAGGQRAAGPAAAARGD